MSITRPRSVRCIATLTVTKRSNPQQSVCHCRRRHMWAFRQSEIQSSRWRALAPRSEFRVGVRLGEVVRRVAGAVPPRSHGPSQLADRQSGTEEQREHSWRPGSDMYAERPRRQTRLLRARRRRSCRPRPRLGMLSEPDEDIQPTWRRDTRPRIAGRRSAQLPTSARSKRALLGTRDARHP
jgi:hypothetical protein